MSGPFDVRHRAALEATADTLHLPMTAAQADALLAYLDLLQRWNTTYNLTAVRDPAAMVVQHLADCLAVIPSLSRHIAERRMRLLDVGSGAGLPGVVLATLLPALDVTCIDAVGKKAAFVRQAVSELRLANLNSVHGRVEALPASGFDVVVSRAFASLSDFVRLSDHALAPGGVWMAMKGKLPTDELAALGDGVDVFHVEPVSVPSLDADRCLVWMRRSGTVA